MKLKLNKLRNMRWKILLKWYRNITVNLQVYFWSIDGKNVEKTAEALETWHKFIYLEFWKNKIHFWIIPKLTDKTILT